MTKMKPKLPMLLSVSLGAALAAFAQSPEFNEPWKNPKVAITIDSNTFPHKVLSIRGRVQLQTLNEIAPEYIAASERYFGPEQGQARVKQLRGMVSSMVRITMMPEWVGLLDFQTRFPSALGI